MEPMEGDFPGCSTFHYYYWNNRNRYQEKEEGSAGRRNGR